MSSWHIDYELGQRYAAGLADLVLAASIEAHLMACPACRKIVAEAVPEQRLAGIWDQVSRTLDVPAPWTDRLVTGMRRWATQAPRFAVVAAVLSITAFALTVAIPLSTGSADDSRQGVNGDTQSSHLHGYPAFNSLRSATPSPEASPGPQELSALTGSLTGIDGQTYFIGTTPARQLTLRASNAESPGYQKATVALQTIAGVARSVVPRAAVVHALSGDWIYTNPKPNLIIRRSVTVLRTTATVAVLSDGPPIGTPIVTWTLPEDTAHPAPGRT
ncbi:MAG: hypothetical protein ABW022_05615 [Actinoplanes sp.]